MVERVESVGHFICAQQSLQDLSKHACTFGGCTGVCGGGQLAGGDHEAEAEVW
jgi:hypothetical protein